MQISFQAKIQMQVQRVTEPVTNTNSCNLPKEFVFRACEIQSHYDIQEKITTSEAKPQW